MDVIRHQLDGLLLFLSIGTKRSTLGQKVIHGMPFRAGRSVTQGGSLSPKLFNILVDTVAREWLHELWEKSSEVMVEEELEQPMATFFAIFYVDNAYLALRDPDFLQLALDILVSLFV
jgi:hypothetical protein